jgi:hypothetical protein
MLGQGHDFEAVTAVVNSDDEILVEPQHRREPMCQAEKLGSVHSC